MRVRVFEVSFVFGEHDGEPYFIAMLDLANDW